MISDACILESQEMLDRAEELSKRSTRDRDRAKILAQKAANLQRTGLSSAEIYTKYARGKVASISGTKPSEQNKEARNKELFGQYLAGKIELDGPEIRNFVAGNQSISFTSGVQGGYTVPQLSDATLRTAMAITDPLLDDNVVDFSMSDGADLQPQTVSGYNLATISAGIVGETVQQNPQIIPTVLGATLKSNLTFRATFGASMEAEQDIPDFVNKIVTATGVALARRIGQSLVSGRGGTSDINGICNGIGVPSVSNGTPGKITLTDILSIYFTPNKFYRSQKKTGWLVNEPTMKYLRAAVDSQNRPLLDVQQEQEILMGKPIYECPSLSTSFTSIGAVGALIFGDLSHFIVRASRPTLQRTIQSGQSDITQGQALFIARMRADGVYFDPSGGAFPPLVMAAIS